MSKLIIIIGFIFCLNASWAMEINRAALFDPRMYQANCQMQDRWATAILESVGLNSAQRILDVGSGDGHITHHIAVAHPKALVLGLDISPEMTDFANKSFKDQPNLCFIVGDAQKLLFREQFDAIVSFSTIHRLTEPKLALAGIFKALRANGKFIAAFPAMGSPLMSRAIASVETKETWKSYFSRSDTKNYNLTDKMLEEWLLEAGFLVIKTQTKWEEEVFKSKQNFRDLLRSTFSHRAFLPADKEIQFFEEIVDEYLQTSPLDEKGKVHFYFNRIEIIAVKPSKPGL